MGYLTQDQANDLANNFLILVLFISQFMFSTTLYNVMVDN